MKIYISADMEGITGVVNWTQTEAGNSEYERFRRVMTRDVNAAIRGAHEAGADEVVVRDAHDLHANILIEELDPRARLISGDNMALSTVHGIDESFAGAFFIGYHAMAGTYMANLDHTWSGCIYNLWLNGTLVGETGLSAAACGHFGVPVVMISSDQTCCDQAMELLGNLEVAVVKQAEGRMAAVCLPEQVSQEKICEAAARAVRRLRSGDAPAPFRLAEPVHIKIDFYNSVMADRAMLLPGARRVAGRTVEYTAPDMLEAYRAFQALDKLAGG